MSRQDDLRPRAGAAAAVALACLVACTGGSLPAPDVAAEIGGRSLRYQEFELYLRENSVEAETDLEAAVLSSLLDRFLEEELIRRLAEEEGWAAPGSTRRVAMRALLERLEAVEVPDREVESYFSSHPAEFTLPERVDLRQILLDDRDIAEQVRVEWVGGTPFAELIERFVAGAGGHHSSDAQLARTDLPPALAGTIFDLEPGEVSEIVKVDYGFHLFQVTARHPAQRLELAESEASIRRKLARELADRELDRMVTEARERYNVQVFVSNLPFAYHGEF